MKKAARGRPVHGILLLDKPLGISSNAALQKAKRLFQAQKAGHTGSLDNLATGLLPVCFGEATKLSGFLLSADKAYEAECQLGVTTTTADAEGEVLLQRDVPELNEAQLIELLQGFLGAQEQVPPMYSALKHQGQTLYSLARQGKTVEREARSIQIEELRLLSWTADKLRFYVRCSKGTYVRTLAEDIGETLGCGAHITALRRVAVGQYRDMVTLEQLQDCFDQDGVAGLDEHLLPLETALPQFPSVTLAPDLATRLCHGQTVLVPEVQLVGGSVVRVFAEGEESARFLGLGEMKHEGALMPKRLLNL